MCTVSVNGILNYFRLCPSTPSIIRQYIYVRFIKKSIKEMDYTHLWVTNATEQMKKQTSVKREEGICPSTCK